MLYDWNRWLQALLEYFGLSNARKAEAMAQERGPLLQMLQALPSTNRFLRLSFKGAWQSTAG